RLQHGVCSRTPLKYTHVDLFGHLPQPHHELYRGNPVLAMSYCYLIQGKCLTQDTERRIQDAGDVARGSQYVCEFDCKPVYVTSCRPRGEVSPKHPCGEVPPERPCGAPCPTYDACESCILDGGLNF
ncbi:uncharacterized protein LOC109504551, partial [Harpegnathos saltator]|uniref:uncharacterized protein LOC109504551 n=1 Tax=Harpegnathos saltator TaxID=610380 RepID=UPI000DBED137